jgi:hypothetical protein
MAHAGDAPHLTLSDFKSETLRGAVGFIRVGQARSGQWWFLDARNRPFFSRGVGSLNRSGRSGGRSARPGPYTATVDHLHGTADSQKFVASALRRLRAWHVNTLGAWATAEFFDRGMFYTEILEFRKIAPETTIKLGGALVPDVFNPTWVEACDQWASALCLPRRESRELIGYFTDNELGWAQPEASVPASGKGGARAAPPTLLQICLSLEPSFPAYHAAWEFTLAAHGGGLEALARAWDVELPNKEALRQLTRGDVAISSPGYARDQERFTREFARRYFTVCSAAIRSPASGAGLPLRRTAAGRGAGGVRPSAGGCGFRQRKPRTAGRLARRDERRREHAGGPERIFLDGRKLHPAARGGGAGRPDHGGAHARPGPRGLRARGGASGGRGLCLAALGGCGGGPAAVRERARPH